MAGRGRLGGGIKVVGYGGSGGGGDVAGVGVLVASLGVLGGDGGAGWEVVVFGLGGVGLLVG